MGWMVSEVLVLVLFSAWCNDTTGWSEVILNTNVLGGKDHNAETISACKSACSASPNCTGIDWNTLHTPGTQCFIIYTTTPGPRNNGTATGINHYDFRRTNCTSK